MGPRGALAFSTASASGITTYSQSFQIVSAATGGAGARGGDIFNATTMATVGAGGTGTASAAGHKYRRFWRSNCQLGRRHGHGRLRRRW